MINSHQFVPQDLDDEYCELCDKHFDVHANIEGITHEDEVADFGASFSDIVSRYRPEAEEW